MNVTRLFDRISREQAYPDWLRLLVLSPSAVVFQGLLYMDRTERAFKLVTTALVGAILYRVLPGTDRTVRRVALAAVCSHGANFLVNGQPWVLLKHFDVVDTSAGEFREWARTIAATTEAESSVAAAAAYGSLSRDELTTTSDFDVRVVRRPGVINGLRACALVASLRFRAVVHRFPLDVYVIDTAESLERMRDDEPPVVLTDEDGVFSRAANRSAVDYTLVEE